MKRPVLLLFLLACNDWQPQHLADQGTVCLEGEADGIATVHVLADRCFTECDRELVAACAATFSGEELILEATYDWESHEGSCDAECGPMEALCQVGPVPEGEWPVILGEEESVAAFPDASCGG